MHDFLQRKSLSEYSRAEFALLLEEIISAKGGEKYQDSLIEHFSDIVHHPDGTDLIFWAPDDESTSEAIIKKIEKWCDENSEECFGG